MNPSPPGGQPDPDGSIIILDRFRPRHRDDPDPITILPVGPGNLEGIPLPGIGIPQKLGQPGDPVLIPRPPRRVETVVVIDEPQPQDCAIRRVTLDPCRRVQNIRVKGRQEGQELSIPFGHKDAAHVPARGPDVIGAERFDEGLGRHGFKGLISRARFRSSASRLDTGTISFARSLFQADRSSMTSSTVSL